MFKSPVVSAIVTGIIVALAFVLNPSPESHRTKISETISARSPLAGALGLGALTAFTSNYHSLGVASYTTVGERTVSAGAFGLVLVFDNSQN
jgi:energy-converting hydrogenase Eha subunit A